MQIFNILFFIIINLTSYTKTKLILSTAKNNNEWGLILLLKLLHQSKIYKQNLFIGKYYMAYDSKYHRFNKEKILKQVVILQQIT